MFLFYFIDLGSMPGSAWGLLLVLYQESFLEEFGNHITYDPKNANQSTLSCHLILVTMAHIKQPMLVYLCGEEGPYIHYW